MSAVRFIVDTNPGENFVAAKLQARVGAANVTRAPLPVGDVVIKHTDARIVVERKSKADYARSVESGHYQRQSGRMQPCEDDPCPTRYMLLCHGARPAYDANPVDQFTRITNKALHSSMCSTMIAHNIPVVWEESQEGVIDLLMHLHAMLTKRGADLFVPKAVSQFDTVGGKRLRDTKNDPKLIVQAMLTAGVSGMSNKKAAAVVAKFPTVRAILEADAKELAVVDVAGRKLGPALAARVAAVFA